jgi:hypothetical protein
VSAERAARYLRAVQAAKGLAEACPGDPLAAYAASLIAMRALRFVCIASGNGDVAEVIERHLGEVADETESLLIQEKAKRWQLNRTTMRRKTAQNAT